MRTATTTLLALAAVGLGTAAPAASAAPGAVTFTGVVTGADGQPLRGVVVDAELATGGNQLPSVAQTRTAADGGFRLVYDAAGDDDVVVQFTAARATGGTSATGYADQCYGGAPWCETGGRVFHTRPGRSFSGLSVALPRAGAATVRAIDGQRRGVGGLSVVLYPGEPPRAQDDPFFAVAYATTDVNGNATLPRLAPWDSYAVCVGNDVAPLPSTPNRDGYLGRCLQDGDERVTVTAGRTTNRPVALVGGGAISGRVVDADGAPIAGATAAVTPYSFFDFRSTTTNGDGRFRLGLLRPGVNGFCVTAEGYRDSCGGQDTPVRVQPFQATPVGTIVLQRAS